MIPRRGLRLLALTFSVSVAGLGFAAVARAATLKPLVQGKRGVVAAGHPLVAEAGLRMLERGGNAVDAGVASVFAATVVEMTSVGLGGECPILIKPAQGDVIAINGIGTAPAMATVNYYRSLPSDDPRRVALTAEPDARPGIIPSYGPLSAMVPGLVDGLLLALEKYGTLKFSEVIEPAIELAEGFPMDRGVASRIASDQRYFAAWPSSQAVYLPGGKPPEEGALFVQRDLAQTFRRMAEAEQQHAAPGRVAGLEAVRDYFYRGAIAQRINDFCEQAGCLIRSSDLAAFHAKIEEPLHTSYRGVEVFKTSFWTQGPMMIEALNLLEGFDLHSMGQNSADYTHTVIEAMKLAMADRDAYYGDPAFSPIPMELISKPYANVRRPLIDMRRASAEHVPGDPVHRAARAPEDFARARLAGRNGDHQDTTCVNVIDHSGTLFSATPSGAWVPAVIVSQTGIPLSERLQSFVLTPGHPNQLAPFKRPRVTLSPSIALRDGKPWLAFSTPGGDWQDECLLQVFLNMVDFQMDPQEAVEAPRFYTRAMYSSFDDHRDHPLTLQLEKRISPPVREDLERRGHQVTVVQDFTNRNAPTVVEFNAAAGTLRAGADVSGYRYALAW